MSVVLSATMCRDGLRDLAGRPGIGAVDWAAAGKMCPRRWWPSLPRAVLASAPYIPKCVHPI